MVKYRGSSARGMEKLETLRQAFQAGLPCVAEVHAGNENAFLPNATYMTKLNVLRQVKW
jgi:hypothetical protein